MADEPEEEERVVAQVEATVEVEVEDMPAEGVQGIRTLIVDSIMWRSSTL